jgi:hypothetical protein
MDPVIDYHILPEMPGKHLCFARFSEGDRVKMDVENGAKLGPIYRAAAAFGTPSSPCQWRGILQPERADLFSSDEMGAARPICWGAPSLP